MFTTCSASAQIPTPSGNTAGVEVVEKHDALSWSEKRFLLRMKEVRLPMPDKIIVERAPDDMSDGVRGWVKVQNPRVIHLTPIRRVNLNKTKPSGPYQMGRGMVYPNGMVTPQTFILAHEMGHMIAPELADHVERPALEKKRYVPKLMNDTYETEAEIIGMVLMDIAFNLSPEQMGIPKRIEYDSARDKRTARLVQVYCESIEETWIVPRVDCSK